MLLSFTSNAIFQKSSAIFISDFLHKRFLRGEGFGVCLGPKGVTINVVAFLF
eukprot:UN27871